MESSVPIRQESEWSPEFVLFLFQKEKKKPFFLPAIDFRPSSLWCDRFLSKLSHQTQYCDKSIMNKPIDLLIGMSDGVLYLHLFLHINFKEMEQRIHRVLI